MVVARERLFVFVIYLRCLVSSEKKKVVIVGASFFSLCSHGQKPPRKGTLSPSTPGLTLDPPSSPLHYKNGLRRSPQDLRSPTSSLARSHFFLQTHSIRTPQRLATSR